MASRRSRKKNLSSSSMFGIDYDFRSMNRACYAFEPLAYLHTHGFINIVKLKAYTSPSGKGFHIRGEYTGAPSLFSQRVMELLAGDDPWRHVFSIMRNEAPWETPLFQAKGKRCVKCGHIQAGEEKYNAELTSRLMKMLEG